MSRIGTSPIRQAGWRCLHRLLPIQFDQRAYTASLWVSKGTQKGIDVGIFQGTFASVVDEKSKLGPIGRVLDYQVVIHTPGARPSTSRCAQFTLHWNMHSSSELCVYALVCSPPQQPRLVRSSPADLEMALKLREWLGVQACQAASLHIGQAEAILLHHF